MIVSQVLRKVLQYAFNVSYEDFAEDLKRVLGDTHVDKDYAQRKFLSMRDDCGRFYCELDDWTQKRFVKVALAHYGADESIADKEI